MSIRGVLGNVLEAAWEGLTAEQRICWHFTAQRNPGFNATGQLASLNGWQYYVMLNTPLAVVNDAHLLADAPTTTTPPNTDPIAVAAWPLPGKLGAGGSSRRPAVTVAWASPGPLNTDVIITQGYDKFRGAYNLDPATQRIQGVSATAQTWITTDNPTAYLTVEYQGGVRATPTKRNKTPRVRHVTTWQQDDEETISLADSFGYFATTDGDNRFSKVRGLTARRRPDLPLARVRFISRENGNVIKGTIPNPTGGSPTNISRPRHYP